MSFAYLYTQANKIQISVNPDSKRIPGTITWFNKTLDKIRILYEDGIDDYIELDEVDGAEIIPM